MSDTIRSRGLRKDPSDAERALWGILRKRGVQGHRFRRQAPVGPYIVDFVCFEIRLVIEVDGGQHAEQADYDAARTAWLESQGFRVMRFWNNEVLEQMGAVKEAVWLEIGGGAPIQTPHPSDSPPS